SLTDVTLEDDNGTPGDPSDDFLPTPLLVGGFNVGDTDQDHQLDPGEEWLYVASTVSACGLQKNIATATGTPVGSTSTVIDTDAVHYVGTKKGRDKDEKDCRDRDTDHCDKDRKDDDKDKKDRDKDD